MSVSKLHDRLSELSELLTGGDALEALESLKAEMRKGAHCELISNRFAFEELTTTEKLTKEGLCRVVAFGDLTGFKLINDNVGHGEANQASCACVLPARRSDWRD